jgi:transcriptional regulator GlxA family with amidase domain
MVIGTKNKLKQTKNMGLNGDTNWRQLAQDAKFQPSAMAAISSVSMRKLQRFCAKKFNLRPCDLTRRLRAEMAVELLKRGYSNKAVVSELFYHDAAHLCHDFQFIFDATPQSFGPGYSGGSA